ncbi:MAG: cytidylate kinase family protein [Candidatus Aenigmarchaeota archaeon]|nr:cytidylate kinase family protein [Candidatus Aenigmarchaeota archaeon]
MVVIAISGKPGAGTSTISKELAKKLGIDYFSPGQKFFKPSERMDDTHEALNTWKTKKGSSKDFHKQIDDYQRQLAKKGNIVICGKLSIWVLKDLADFKVWLDCDFEERAGRSAERDGINLEEARRKLKEREETEKQEWKRIYDFDRDVQQEMADLVIDTSKMSVKEVVEKIITLGKT